ncbi:MAG TPA: phosphoribosylglycinamide formyltransferase [Ktedonobacterales bacterium]
MSEREHLPSVQTTHEPVHEPVHEHVLGVLVSGRGSNLRAILEAIERGELPARVGIVISSRANVPALEIAARYGIPTHMLRLRDYASRAELGEAMVRALRAAHVELVVLAGYNLIFHPCVLRAFPDGILNIHPSLLPAFAGGMAPKPQEDALVAGVKITGCTVHFVTEKVDAGPILAQAAVPVHDDDTVETLSARILAEEHCLYPRAIALALSGRVRIEGTRTFLAPPPNRTNAVAE